MPTNHPDLLTTGQAAKVCSVTPDTILKWIKKGRLPGVRTAGGHYRIRREDLQPHVTTPVAAEGPAGLPAERCSQGLRCWEYLGDRGAVRDDCRQCVVYRGRATRCFGMAGPEAYADSGRPLCQTSCEDCVYYRRVNGLPTNVLLITADEELVEQLAGETDNRVVLRFARNAYEASAIIHDLRPAFVAIDAEQIPEGDATLLDCLASDPRVPGLRIILMVSAGTAPARRSRPEHELPVSILEKPFTVQEIAAVINRFPVVPLMLEQSSL